MSVTAPVRRLLLMLSLVVAVLALAPVAGAWTWPVDGPVLQPFVFDSASPYAAGEHRGGDIGADAGRAVLAPAGASRSAAAPGGAGHVRRLGPLVGQIPHDYNGRRLRGHAHAPRVDRLEAGR